ncbi:MAG: GntR family transcriptional regulator [Opitutales bacterium]
MPLPELRLDPSAPSPLYRQLADRLHFAINTGQLTPGEALPSLRTIARERGLALNTVVKAFRHLESAGLVRSAPRRGYEVAASAGRASVPHMSSAVVQPPSEGSSDGVATEPKGKRATKAASEHSRYAQRGVSSSKTDVHAVVDRLDAGVFPGAFCKITEDFLTSDPFKCNVIHADGSGTKSIIAY